MQWLRSCRDQQVKMGGVRMARFGGQQPHLLQQTMSSNRAVCTKLQPSIWVALLHMTRRLVYMRCAVFAPGWIWYSKKSQSLRNMAIILRRSERGHTDRFFVLF